MLGLGWWSLCSLVFVKNTLPHVQSLHLFSCPAWWVCFSRDQGDFCRVWNLWDCCGSAFLAPVHVYNLHHTRMLLHVYVKPAPSHPRRPDLCSLGWFFCCTQGRRHVRKKLSSRLHVYESLIHGGVGGGGATQKQSIILRLKWTWNYCHTIWLRLLNMDEYTAGVVSCFCRHQQLQFQVLLAF